MNVLETHHLLFTAQVTRTLGLDEHSGSALRGNLFEGVWRRFCTNKEAVTCAECSLHQLCPVSSLVAPLRDGSPRGRDIPRPYILLPPLEGRRTFAPGETFTFGLTLFGQIIELLPYLLLVTSELERAGLGRRMDENRGQRGMFQVQLIEAYQPLTGQREALYRAGKLQANAPTLSVRREDVVQRASTVSSERITLRFVTPMHLIHHQHVLHTPVFHFFIARLLERLEALEREYGQGQREEPSSRDWRELVERAEDIRSQLGDIHWEEVHSYSRRSQYMTDISGFTGTAIFTGDLSLFHELLVWGELIHVGKNTVKGNGWYRIEG